MAGLIFVLSITLVTLGNLSRGQTWLPLAGLLAAAAIGVVDDIMNIRGSRKDGIAGMRARTKFGLYSVVGQIGVLLIALFWLVVIATAISVNITDGLDGLAGGLLTSSFTAYAVIAAVE